MYFSARMDFEILHLYNVEFILLRFSKQSAVVMLHFLLKHGHPGQWKLLDQGSGTYGSRARCGSFDDCIWLSQIKFEFEKHQI